MQQWWFNKKTYTYLLERSQWKQTDQQQRYDLTYPIYSAKFSRKKVIEYTDLIQCIWCAYSWMPTIPKISDVPDEVVDLVNLIISTDMLSEYHIEQLSKTINNSIVGTSKVLHFLRPHIFPIIDSKVLKNRNRCFPDHTLCLTASGYIEYTRKMHYRRDQIREVSLRDLERVLFMWA